MEDSKVNSPNLESEKGVTNLEVVKQQLLAGKHLEFIEMVKSNEVSEVVSQFDYNQVTGREERKGEN